jgi:dihydropteroate synthase
VSENKVVTLPSGKLDFSGGCLVMGILNVTPDSFSDGGKFVDFDAACRQGVEMANSGAAIIDVGGESTRPGAEAVSADEQISRAVGVVKYLSENTDAVISIDTRDADVACAAIEAGAEIVNDVTALADERIGKLVADNGVGIVLMHMQGEPQTMQANPVYGDVVAEVLDYLQGRAKFAQECGVEKERIFIDPGIGFGKRLEHNIELLVRLDRFVASGYRVLLGTSRKRFIGDITGKSAADERVFGTAATVAIAAAASVSVVRVHDVGEMADVLKVTKAITGR